MTRGRAAVDGVMFAVGAALLVSVPVRDAATWPGWAAVAVLGAGLGVLAAAVARSASGRNALVALGLLFGPAAVLAVAGGPGYAFTYLVAHGLGIKAGRWRYPAR